MNQLNKELQGAKNYFQSLVELGGPDVNDYETIDSYLSPIAERYLTGEISKQDLVNFWDSLGSELSTPETLIGFVLKQPHGYAGDFEIIDRIYRNWESKKANLVKWDKFFHMVPAAQAIRNRRNYFVENTVALAGDQSISVLNVGSGPCRDVADVFELLGDRLNITCIDQDINAINHASMLNEKNLDNIQFVNKNVFKFKIDKQFDFVWCAGVFDYFNDDQFVHMFKLFWSLTKPNGVVSVGNFSTNNPNKSVMDSVNWVLEHRSDEHLLELGRKAGIPEECLSVEHEPLGVNAFLKAKKIA